MGSCGRDVAREWPLPPAIRCRAIPALTHSQLTPVNRVYVGVSAMSRSRSRTRLRRDFTFTFTFTITIT